ncbi:MAG: precorrin-2 C(20)-methyltransferase [Synergistaceae bacterium]|nr:precorrin-2 C(20)-methyltransferase [Synergistaceae bacterium]
MRLIIAGLGPGDFELVTLSALNAAKSADLIIVPQVQGRAEKILAHHFPDAEFAHIVFPMVQDAQLRHDRILSQLEELRPEWENTSCVFFPVIGDAMLYSTGAYLLDVFKELVPEIEAEFIPGISAHSLAASCAKKFMALGQEIFAIIPGTANPEKIRRTLEACDCAAIYKTTALRNIRELVQGFSKIIRVDFAGIPELERITEGPSALDDIHEYLSVILLWRN